MKDYHTTLKLNTTVNKLFQGLTRELPFWWTDMFEGSAMNKDDIFTVRFGDNVYKTMKIEGLIYNEKVVWHVENSLIGIPELKNQTEWIGTTIIWELTESGSNVVLQLTHIGLNPEIECYDICSRGWQQFTDSLKSYIETGKGKPFSIKSGA